jgi:hypothetical protein
MAVFWEPLSQAIVFGLSFAALLTLVATPALLACHLIFVLDGRGRMIQTGLKLT